ncbi:methyltransferase [Aromatoleum toluvorans]|uniref:Methyltransferase n=1 Tax=Aromatoleum toluvorans TaxID=92002 RepID=A0ABX1Q3H4_9RHOO|nr:class I SAM-dependent methyltransferase [Aromatoleum toluvorans]NMG44886.1 methyltransferase [Aromatoleum toluvorans]
MNGFPQVVWDEDGERHALRWRSESGSPPPRRVVVVGDQTPADQAYRLACEGTALLYRGDYQNARQLLLAMGRRADRKPRRAGKPARAPSSAAEAFHLHRQAQAQRARTLGMLLLPVDADHSLPLRRAPDVALACREAYGPADEAYAVSLRELLGLIGAHEWRKKGVSIPALGASIHPHYGVFSPVRGEYVDLVAQAPLPAALASGAPACDIGTGTGVLAALLAQRGVRRVLATDQDPRALECACENIARLGFAAQVEILQADMFPDARAALVVCNPPWVPARPSSPVENAVYDPDSRMLRAFLAGLAAHLVPGGEGWLILSDLAEHLGLRTRDELLAAIAGAGLQVVGRLNARPRHAKARDADDPLHAARAAEITSLWRLATRA